MSDAIGRHPVQTLRQDPVVIGGCARSGSTLLVSILSSHPHIYAVSRGDRNLESNAMARDLSQDTENITMLYEHQLRDLPDTFSHWCEKSPKNVLFIREILDFFGDRVRFLNIVRDGRDVVTSRHPHNPERYWVDPDRWVNEASAGTPFDEHPQVMLVRYEELIGDFAGVVARICEFIGVANDASLLAYPDAAAIQTSVSWFESARPIHAASIGRWSRPEHQDQVSRLFETPGAIELLQHYGYV